MSLEIAGGEGEREGGGRLCKGPAGGELVPVTWSILSLAGQTNFSVDEEV